MPDDSGSSRSGKPWYIDGFGAHYLELYSHRNEREAELALKLLTQAGLTLANLRVLDLACGGGRHLRHLRRRGARPLGLDLSRPLLEEAQRNLPRDLPLLRADMRTLPLRDQSFSLVLSMFTSFAYFESDQENWSVVQEVARVLKDGGHYLLDFLNRGSLSIRADSEREGEHFRALESRRIEEGRVHKKVRILDRETLVEKLEYEESVRLYSRSEILDAAEESGLSLVQEWGSYLGDPWEEGSSPRLILLFQRVPR